MLGEKSEESYAPPPPTPVSTDAPANGMAPFIGMLSNMMSQNAKAQAEMAAAMREDTNRANNQMIENFKTVLAKEVPPPPPQQIDVLALVKAVKEIMPPPPTPPPPPPPPPAGPTIMEQFEFINKLNAPMIAAITAASQKVEKPSKAEEMMNLFMVKQMEKMDAPKDKSEEMDVLGKAFGFIEKVKQKFGNESEIPSQVITGEKPSMWSQLLPSLMPHLLKMMGELSSIASAPKVSENEINNLRTGLMKTVNALKQQALIHEKEYQGLRALIKSNPLDAIKAVSQDERIVSAKSPIARSVKKSVMEDVETIQRNINEGNVIHDGHPEEVSDEVPPIVETTPAELIVPLQQTATAPPPRRVIRINPNKNKKSHAPVSNGNITAEITTPITEEKNNGTEQ